MGNHFVRLLLCCSFLMGISLLASQAHANSTIETSRRDINIWSQAGNTSGGKIESIRAYEQVRVTGSTKLSNGETWYKVAVERYPGWDKVVKTGWVNGKYFTKGAGQAPAARVETSANTGCVNCTTRRANQPLQRQTQDLAAVADRASGFIWPTVGRISSPFGPRIHPIKRVRKMHKGIDIAGNNGAQVVAIKGGTVEVSRSGCRNRNGGCNGGAGNYVTINHGDGTKSRYLHLNTTCALPRQGTRVKQGQSLGCVGSTGAVTGPHLHFEIIKNGTPINPVNVLPRRRS